MPYRKTILVPGEIYHVFNRSVARLPIFLTEKDYQRALEVIQFYSFIKPSLRFSHYNRLPTESKYKFLDDLFKNGKKQIKLLAFCLMPNHFHLLLKEIEENGISLFIKNFQGSYAKYFNIKNDRNGSLFQSRFKAVRIETDEQFIHVARYIHLNPLTAFVLKEIKDLEEYSWCSYKEYIGKSKMEVAEKEQLLTYFSSIEKLKSFTADQMDYQRALETIKHLALE